MAEARAGLAEMHLGVIAAYWPCSKRSPRPSPATRPAAERAVRDAEALISESDSRWYLSFIYVDLAHAILAQGRLPEAAEAVGADRDDVGRRATRSG